MAYRLLCLVLAARGITEGFQLRLPPISTPRSIKLSSVVTVTPTTIATPELPDTKQGRSPTFDWKKQWYPVLALKTSDNTRVHAVQVLGKDLVVWRNSEGRWSTFDDRCPHRAAPLTEGRVEKDGSLLCAYHAWRFDADGKCLSIPQSENRHRDERQSRACVKHYPTQVAQDMIWVWGDNGPDAGLESALTPPVLIPELNDVEAIESGRVTAGSILQRDLPYAWETFIENVVDPSHVVVSHHGVMGTRDQAAPVKLELTKSGITLDGFTCANKSPMWKGTKGTTYFRAPVLARTDTENKDGSVVTFVVYSTPSSPGRCRMLVRQVSILPKAEESGKKPDMVAVLRILAILGLEPHNMPDWLQHLLGHLVLNQDLATLHHQEKILASSGSNYFKSTFVPAAADRPVVALRKWIATFGSGGPTWAAGVDPTLPPREHRRAVLYDIYEQHTKNCTSCLGAAKRVKELIDVAKASAVASLIWAVLRGSRAINLLTSPSASVLNIATLRAMLPGVAMMFGSLGCAKGLETLHNAFHTGDHCHQDHD